MNAIWWLMLVVVLELVVICVGAYVGGYVGEALRLQRMRKR